MEAFSCFEKTLAQMEHNDSYVREIKRKSPSECNSERQSSTMFGDSTEKTVSTTVISTENEFIQDFGGVVKSEITVDDYEPDGVIESELTHDQNVSEQLNEAHDLADSGLRVDLISSDEIPSIKMLQNENNFQQGVKVEIGFEQPCSIEKQSSAIFEDFIDKPIILPKKTVICTEDVFIQDFGGVVKSEISLGDYKLDSVIKSEITHDRNEWEQSKEAIYVAEAPVSRENHEENVSNELDLSVKLKMQNQKGIETGRKQFRCDECDKQFSYQSHLNLHKRIHSNDNPFKCKVCKRAFLLEVHLEMHKLIHSNEKPYKCEECGKSFLRQWYLEIHKRNHTNENPFKCYVCSGTFSLQSHLTKHKQIHKSQNFYR